MIKVLVAADEEMRQLVRQEVSGALTSMSNARMSEAINEGIARAGRSLEVRRTI